MNYQHVKISAFLLTLSFSVQVVAVQDVYEYKNSEGVVEFTDAVKTDKKLEKHIQIKKMTPEEEALGKQKLDQIMKKDQALDERLAKERQLENKRRQEAQKQANDAQKNKEQDYEKGTYRNRHRRGYHRRRPVSPDNPNRPTPAPLPASK